MQALETTVRSYTFQDFLHAVATVRKKEMEEQLPSWIALAQGHQQNPGKIRNRNLFRAPDGTIWTYAVRGGGFCRHVPGLSETQRLDLEQETIPELPEGCVHGQLEPWVWEFSPYHRTLEARMQNSFEELGECLRCIGHSRESIQFADHILAEERRAELEQWFLERAQTSDRTGQVCEEDCALLVKTFGDAIGLDAENAYLITLEYRSEIHRLLDVLAGRADIQRWY